MNIKKTHHQLLKKYGKQGWWPLFIKHDTRDEFRIEYGLAYGISYPKLKNYKTNFRDPYFEIAIGAILTQNTAWQNVAKAIVNLYYADALTPGGLLKIHPMRLQKLIRPAGYFRQKAKKLRDFSKWLLDNYDGDITSLKKFKIKDLRSKLLKQWGIGNETADSIMLYALNKPIFVIDEYTRRLCKKNNVALNDYEEYRELFEASLYRSAKLYQEYHALIVAWGKARL